MSHAVYEVIKDGNDVIIRKTKEEQERIKAVKIIKEIKDTEGLIKFSEKAIKFIEDDLKFYVSMCNRDIEMFKKERKNALRKLRRLKKQSLEKSVELVEI